MYNKPADTTNARANTLVVSKNNSIVHQPFLVRVTRMTSKLQAYLFFVARVSLLLFFTLTFFLSAFSTGRASLRAALSVPSLLGASESSLLVTNEDPIQHTQMTLSSAHGSVFLDIFAPVSPSSPIAQTNGGLLIIPGVGDNRQVPQLVNLLTSLAHTGITAMAMTTPDLINYNLSADDGDAAMLAFQKLSTLPNVNPAHVGIISFSGGVLAATLAAADARIRDNVAYVTSFGGYFNALDLLRTFGRRSIDIDGHSEPWNPDIVPLQVFGNVLTQALSASNRSLIRNALTQNGIPLTSDEIATLSSPARSIYHLLMGDQPNRIDANIDALPPSILIALQNLSPSALLSRIHAPIFLLHDRNDSSIPVTESRDFDAALTRLHHVHDYVEFHIFDHVLVRSHLNFWQTLTDGTHLFFILQRIIMLSSC